MFKRQTLFILGAGSSHEVGLPLGRELATSIGKMTDIRFEQVNRPTGVGDMNIYSQLTQGLRVQAHEYQDAGWLIRDGVGFAQSIDDFLDQHRNNQFVNVYGKAALVKAILDAERKSKLYFGGDSGIETFNAGRFADTWFVKFMHMLGRGISKENVRTIFDRVAFITFNYDRCLARIIHDSDLLFHLRAVHARHLPLLIN
jgi:hypothetical protein